MTPSHAMLLVSSETYCFVYDNVSPPKIDPSKRHYQMTQRARQKARSLFHAAGMQHLVGSVVFSRTNGVSSFTVHPCGATRGSDTFMAWDKACRSLIEWLESCAYDDGSNPFRWCSVELNRSERNASVQPVFSHRPRR